MARQDPDPALFLFVCSSLLFFIACLSIYKLVFFNQYGWKAQPTSLFRQFNYNRTGTLSPNKGHTTLRGRTVYENNRTKG